MQSIGAYEAKTHLSQLLDRVCRGERFTITRHGVPVAVLQPPDCLVREDPGGVADRIREFRKGRTLGDVTIKELIEKGRK
jgi:prevent-host-death family protein